MRAKQQLDRLKDEVVWWREGGPYTLATDFDADRGVNSVLVEHVDALPAQWPTVIGETLHNLRSALDNLAWDLAFSHSKKEVSKTEFPIFRDVCGFARWSSKKNGPAPGSGLYKVRGIAPEPQAIIERLQPYNRADWVNDPLWLLHHLNIIDKHRSLHLVSAIVSYSYIRVGDRVTDFTQTIAPGPLKAETVVAEIPSSQLIDPDVNMSYHLGVAPAFGERTPVAGRPVLDVLDGLREVTLLCLNSLTPFIPGVVGLDESNILVEPS